jgi:HEPN domain-containing protein
MSYLQAFEELDKAKTARNENKEGMARVLARRAAGLAIRAFLHEQGMDSAGLSLNDLLTDIETKKHLPDTLQEALIRLSTRVGVDYQLPPDYDLISDSHQIIQSLSILTGENL